MVNANGIVTAATQGSGIITAQHAGLEASSQAVVDFDCSGPVDEIPAPSVALSLTLDYQSYADFDLVLLFWEPLPNAASYSIVEGDLYSLHSTSGDYASVTAACTIASSAEAGFFEDSVTCDGISNQVNGLNCQPGTFDTGSPTQLGSRDAEIQSSPFSCPW
jgi:hypothetical protein